MVYGFGEKKTPAVFVAACDKFSFTEILRLPWLSLLARQFRPAEVDLPPRLRTPPRRKPWSR